VLSGRILKHALYASQIGANSLVGYVFARLLAYQFGTSAQKDGFDIAYAVPFIVLELTGFAHIHSVITTQFARMLAAKSSHINSVFSIVLTWMMTMGFVLLVLAAWFSDSLTHLMAPGLSATAHAETRHLLLLMLPLAMTLGIGTYLGAVLTAHEVPVTGEFCQLASRLGVIVFIVYSGFRLSLPSTAVGLVIASVVGLIIQWWILYSRTEIRFRPPRISNQPEFRVILKQGLGFLACTLCAQFAMAYMRRLAILDGVGTNAALTYAIAAVMPLSLILGKPLALTIAPQYATLAANKRWIEARRLLIRAGASCLMFAFPVCLLASQFAVPLVRLLFAGGRFDETSTAVTASLCALIVWALPASLLRWVIVMPALSTRNSSLPGAILAIGHLAHIAFSALLFPPLGKYGIVAAYVAAINLQALLGTGFLIYEWRSASYGARQIDDSEAGTRVTAHELSPIA
jgi:peptidoglycan biosynthesis protein MviN/MurJ (putative lipid II flippase)